MVTGYIKRLLHFFYAKASSSIRLSIVVTLVIHFGCLLLSAPIFSQTAPIFDHLVPTEALTTTSTTSILQDYQGYVWIGTTNGLNRFDGQNVKHFFHTPADSTSLSNAFVSYNAIIEHNKTLWIGTEDGLNRYNSSSESFEQFYHNPTDPSTLCGNYVGAILPAGPTTLWIGTDKGLCQLNTQSGIFRTFRHIDSDLESSSNIFISALALDSSQNLWIGTYAGLFKHSAEDQVFTSLISESDVPLKINTLLVDHDKLWIGTENAGIFQSHIPSGKITPITEQPSTSSRVFDVTNLLLDQKGQLWAATFGHGLCQLNRITNGLDCFENDPNTSSSLIDDQIMGIMQDYEGHIWASTWHGVTKMNRSRGFANSSGPGILPNQRINAIHEDSSGHLWLGSVLEGLSRFDPISGSITAYKHIPGNRTSISGNEIWSITGNKELLWVGTGSGLNAFNFNSKLFTRYFNRKNDSNSLSDNAIYSVFLDDQDSLWVGTVREGLNKLINKEAGLFKRFQKPVDDDNVSSNGNKDSLTSNIVWPIYQNEANVLWLGTLNGGLNKLEIKENRFKAYRFSEKTDSINSNDILHITGDEQENLWISTQANGFNKFEVSEEKFTAYTVENGLANNEVSCIIPDDHNRLWIGTRKGLSVFDKSLKTFLNFYKPSGLTSNNFLAGACLKSTTGKFHFGTDKGLLSFFPDSIDLEVPSPRLVISELRINNKISQFDNGSTKLSFIFKENTLSFRASILTYAGSEENQLSYRMTGLDTTWLPVEPSGLINFTTLPADDYILEVKGKNSFGVYNERPLKLEITINPPYWQTWWFRLLSALLVISIFTTLYKARVSYLLAVEQETQKAEKLRIELNLAVEQEALKTEKMRNEFAADFHDSIGTGLDILGLDIDLITDNQETPSKIRDQLSPLRESIDNLADMRKEMGWIINAKNDATDKLFERIRQVAFKRVPSGILSVDIPHNLPVVRLPIEMRRHLLNFVKEALTNAVKHAKASTIELKISHSDGIYTFAIADDGIGFDIDEEEKGEGLETMSLRAEAVGGKYTILQPDEGGSVIKLSVKIDDSSHYAS